MFFKKLIGSLFRNCNGWFFKSANKVPIESTVTVPVTYTLTLDETALEEGRLEVLFSGEIPWQVLPVKLQRTIITSAFKICWNAGLRPIRSTGRFRVDRVTFDKY